MATDWKKAAATAYQQRQAQTPAWQQDPSWNDFAVAMGRMNQRSLYESTLDSGYQQARAGFFDSLKSWAPEHFEEMRLDNLEANANLQNMISMGMEDYKKDPLSREAIAQAPFDQQIPLGSVSSGLPGSGAGSPNGINIQSNRFADPSNKILHSGAPFLTYDDLDTLGGPPEDYDWSRERQAHHEGLHTVMPGTGAPRDKGYYSLFSDEDAKVIPDEEYRVRQLVNAYASGMGRPVPEFESRHVDPIQAGKNTEFLDKAVARRRSNRSNHPTESGFTFWDNLQGGNGPAASPHFK